MIWPFNRKQRQAEEQARESEEQERMSAYREEVASQLKEIEAFVAVGERFCYLGVEFVCIGCGKYEALGLFVQMRPALIAEYVNARGEIERKEFPTWMLPILRKENAKEAEQ